MENIDKLKKVGSGSASDVYLLKDNLVLIIGKREDCFSNYQSLVEKAKLIDGKILSINYPKIHELISPSKDFPFGAMIEDFVEGKELREVVSLLSDKQKIEIGKNISNFLKELHVINFVGSKDEEIEINSRKFDRSMSLLKSFIDEKTYKQLLVVKEEYVKFMENKEFCLTHGDLNAGNILISNDNKLSGLIDFGNMEYYVPEIEFSHMYFFDKIIYSSMVEEYGKEIKEKDILLLELVTSVRHFKNIINFEEKRENCLKNIKKFINEYFNFQVLK